MWRQTATTDGRYVATASKDATARVWEVLTGREVARIKQPNLTDVVFSDDGKWLATVAGEFSSDAVVRAWLWRPEDLIAATCARLTRNLTTQEWSNYIGAEAPRSTCRNLPPPLVVPAPAARK